MRNSIKTSIIILRDSGRFSLFAFRFLFGFPLYKLNAIPEKNSLVNSLVNTNEKLIKALFKTSQVFYYILNKYLKNNIFVYNGGYSSVGRASDCGSECRGFEPRYSPHHLKRFQCNFHSFGYSFCNMIESAMSQL